jgi:hypothetical protein
MSQKCYGIFDSTAATFAWKDCENRKILKVDISTKSPHAGEPVYVFEMCITARDRSGMAAWLGAVKEGAQEGKEEKISLTGIEVGRSSCCLLGLRN